MDKREEVKKLFEQVNQVDSGQETKGTPVYF